jgi:hypothetical protein
MASEHEWRYVQFNYASWTECSCGYVPDTEELFYIHTNKYMAVE